MTNDIDSYTIFPNLYIRHLYLLVLYAFYSLNIFLSIKVECEAIKPNVVNLSSIKLLNSFRYANKI